jgi:prepilin-type N-terminal cleavage/methylation domain-containing protein
MRHTRHHRRGVTLMEVLISIFILSVGMLGVAALIPIGRHTLVETGKADRSGACGRAAMRLLKNTRVLERSDTVCYRWYQNGTTTINPYDSLCLDPLGCARNSYSSTLRRFPSSTVNLNDSSNTYAMPRISLYLPGTTTPMPLETAQRWFTWDDDRLFDIPTDNRAQRPRQMLLFDNDLVAPVPRLSAKDPVIGTSATALTLESEGAYSWMATLSPHYWYAQGASRNTTPTLDQLLYNVSIVVFYRRDFSLPRLEDAVPSERVANVDRNSMTSLSVGVGGGRILLYVARRSPDNQRWLDLEPGQWIMLAGRTSTQPVMTLFRWYRVVSMGDTHTSGSYYRRYVSLEGPDWPMSVMSQTRAVIMTGVVGVYTMPLEREEAGGLWDPR